MKISSKKSMVKKNDNQQVQVKLLTKKQISEKVKVKILHMTYKSVVDYIKSSRDKKHLLNVFPNNTMIQLNQPKE